MRPAPLPGLLLLAALLLLPLAAAGQEAAPRAPTAIRDGGGVHLTRLPSILGRDEVRRHLDTGLTTSFLFKVSLRLPSGGSTLKGAARVEIRYEPWDEVYQLAALGLDGRLVQHNLSSFGDLESRWRDLRLLVLVPPERTRLGVGPKLRIDLEVLPFSSTEQRDTRRWFSESLERSGRGNAENAGQVSEERSETLGEVFNLLMATSIQRRAVVDYRWTSPVAGPTRSTP